jgi:hypothetical protein
MKTSLFKQFVTASIAATAFAASAAMAVPFSITNATVTGGTGYGVDASESQGSANLLDVLFPLNVVAPQNFNLMAVGNSYTFTIGNIVFRESNNSGGIRNEETDNLGVTATFTFATPGAGNQVVTTMGAPVVGSVQDEAVDFRINWSPIIVGFGTSGQYQIDLADLAFDEDFRTQVQTATITLVALDQGTVPEPSSLALAGLGLLAAAGVTRRRTH